MSQFGFFNVEDRLQKIYQINSFLPKLNTLIDWESFRPTLERIRVKERLSNAGRPAFDVVLMFKILILQTLYTLADDKTEAEIRDRLSFMDFLGLTIADVVPDSKTIWLFREELKTHGIERKLFDKFNEELAKKGLKTQCGKIVDGTFVEVPRQHNKKEENDQIKAGIVPERFEKNPNVKEQKDLDASWTKKNKVSYYGYKDHVLCDSVTKFIDDYDVTDASVHDSKPFLGLMQPEAEYEGQEIYADSAYTGAAIDAELRKRKYEPQICEKGYRNKPLTDEQKAKNKEKSRTRSRVEHVFGSMQSLGMSGTIRCIGKARAACVIGLRNLTYNMCRFVSIISPRKAPKKAK